MKKLNLYIKAALCLLLAAAAVFPLAGCADKGSGDIREDFLVRCYTSNYGGRYDRFEQAGDYPTESDVDEFYSCLKNLCSKELYKKLKNGYMLIVYDKNAHENGFDITPCDIVFKEYETNGKASTYLFIMTLDICGTEESSNSLAGTITVEKNRVTDVTFAD